MQILCPKIHWIYVADNCLGLRNLECLLPYQVCSVACKDCFILSILHEYELLIIPTKRYIGWLVLVIFFFLYHFVSSFMLGITGEIIHIIIWIHIPIQYYIFLSWNTFSSAPRERNIKTIIFLGKWIWRLQRPKTLYLFALLWKFQMMPRILLWALAMQCINGYKHMQLDLRRVDR